MIQTVSLIGVSSFVGSRLFTTLKRVLSKHGNYYITGTYFSRQPAIADTEHLNLAKPDCLRDYILRHRPAILILVAGSKDVARCESDPDYAYRLNTAPVEILCDCIAQNKLDTRFLYISSDYVFGGAVGGYKAGDPPSPNTNYGRSKASAERRLLCTDVNGIVIRTSAVMAHHGGFLGWLIHSLQNIDMVKLLDNSLFTPTPIELLADCMSHIIFTKMDRNDRIFHACGSIRMSRYEFGVLVSELLTELGMGGENCKLERELLPRSRDLSLIPNVFPYGNDQGLEVLKTYLRAELKLCIA